ncbi:unnamed protein product [Anisakis simplex]|uniref:PNP_UDP_1 domain-containing protein n=1 Tax=Anisakis simplex TaxID=6269 RepID=A0A0M3JY34_ANISI|nr:unnamed protein product [Anisakis simplex]
MADSTGGKVPLLNPILAKESEDHLYHFGITRSGMDLPKLFGDIKFVCCGGSATRLAQYAQQFSKEIGIEDAKNLSKSDRYVMYKTGPVLWINHGMGVPSLSIMMIETIKLLHYANASDVTFIRLGTSGGVGVQPGTVIVSNGAVNGEIEQSHIQYIMGKKVLRPAVLDKPLGEKLYALAKQLNLPVETGKTFCADDFYEGQARVDGAFCEYTVEDKFNFLRRLYENGVRNIEMESTCFAAMTRRAGIRAAIVCVTLVNRMEGDQVDVEKSLYHEFEGRPFKLITAFIKQQMGIEMNGDKR